MKLIENQNKWNEIQSNKLIHSSWKIVNEELLSELNSMDNISDLQLLLSVIASYYINWEQLPEWRTSELTVKFINNLLKNNKLNLKFNGSKGYWAHLAYIKKHLELYYNTRNNWRLYFKWDMKIEEIILNVWKKLHKFKWFRNGIVSHWPWAKLTDKQRKRANITWDNKTLHENANFVFPPNNYISELLRKLDLKLKQKDIWVYKKAAYIGSYIFLSHPFFDWNSRTSRMLMISYLDYNDKKFIKLYTFLATFLNDLPSYDDFLTNDIYSMFDKFRDKVSIEEIRDENWKLDTKITSYLDTDEYEKIVDKAAIKLEKRLILISKYIYKNMDDINILLRLVALPSGLKWHEKIVTNYFLKNLFDILKEQWLWWLKSNKNEIFVLPDKFFKENKIETNTIKKIENIFENIITL